MAGDWGADVVVGEGQVFGTGLGFGGPTLACSPVPPAHVRRLPGRLVGESVDVDGRRAYVATLRAREQDIRREKATSNVCTNQTLMAVTAAIQLGWLGTSGLAEIARRCTQATRYTHQAVLGVGAWRPPPTPPSSASSPCDFRAPRRSSSSAWPTRVPGRHRPRPPSTPTRTGLLIAVTERRTRAEIDAYVTALAKAVADGRPAAEPPPRRAARPTAPHSSATAPSPPSSSSPSRSGGLVLRTTGVPEVAVVRAGAGRASPTEPVPLAEVSERDLVGHFTRLCHRQFSVDLGAYPWVRAP